MIKSILLFILLHLSIAGFAQDTVSIHSNFLEPAKVFNKKRFLAISGLAIGGYSAAMIGLNQLWYADYERSSFHFFNDSKEWNQMDKAGHAFTAYFETEWAFETTRWTGLDRRRSLLLGAGLSTLYQTSIEVLDGFSEKWGFSISDVAFNTLGTGLFVGQELLWQEQRIRLKVSSGFMSYPDVLVPAVDGESPDYTIRQRAEDLYGGGYFAGFLKDYNRMTIWLSFNMGDFLPPKDRKLSFLNLAIGYGVGNLYGGFSNRWEAEGVDYVLDKNDFPRYRQFFLAPDIDFRKIPTKSRFLKIVFGALNILKMPSPAVEMNTKGKVKWHWLYW